MRRVPWLGFGLLVLAGCPAGWSDLCDDSACDPPDASSDSPKDVVADVPGCDITKDPKDSPKCIDDAVGVFVSPTGADTNPGTKASPVATLGKALTIAGKARIYLCEGTYQGSADVTKTVGIFGGLKCDWSLGGAKAGRPGRQAGVRLEARCSEHLPHRRRRDREGRNDRGRVELLSVA